MSIGKVFSKNNIVKYLTKGAGITALGVVAFDSHILGKIQADSYSKRKDADACADTFNNTEYLSNLRISLSRLRNLCPTNLCQNMLQYLNLKEQRYLYTFDQHP